MFIRQPSVFSFEDALKLQPMSRLEMVMNTLDLKPILAMVPDYRTGPKGYSFEAKLRALLAARIERIIGMAALVRRLKYDPVFRFACGFDVIGPVPSEAAFSRFNDEVTKMKGLEPVFQSLVSLAETMELIDGSAVSIDATKLDAYEKSKPQKYVSPDGQNADWGVKRNTDGNKTKWFGYKLHQSVDAKSGLPLAITITSASVHDTQPVVELMNKTRANLAGNPSYWVMDAAYDSLNIYETVMNDFHAQAIIALNHRGAKQPKAGYDFDGTPVCSAGFKMTYWGHHHGINKFRCPHVLGKVDCPFGSAWCSSSNYGLVVKTKAKDDPRMFNTPHRGSSNWKQLYNQRTASERCFGRQKEHLGLDEIRHRGVEKVETHAYLCNIALLATVIAINTPEKANVAA